MKIISLNTFGGHVFEPLMEFIKTHSTDTDVFCFQEIVSSDVNNIVLEKNGWRLNLLQEIIQALPDFDFHFAPMQDDFEVEPDYPGQSQFGVAIFWRKNLDIREKGNFFICHERNHFSGGNFSSLGHAAVYAKINTPDKPIVICSLHGNSQPADKRDSPLRIEQSKRVLNFLSKHPDAEQIVMGDFNLFPDTESIRMFAKEGFRNLVTEYDIKTTRGSMMRKLFPEYEHGKYGFQEFADYTFTSSGIHVEDFSVPDEPISDHLPMIMHIK